MATEPALQVDPVKYKETTTEQWQTAAEPWSRWASLAEYIAPRAGYCTRAGSKTESGVGVLWEGGGGASRHKLTGRRLERVAVNPTNA
jgi:hypothetical protein